MKRLIPALLAGAAGLVAYAALASPRSWSGGGRPPTAGAKASVGDDVFVRATIPALSDTPGIRAAAFAIVRVENALPEGVYGRVRGLLIPDADGSLMTRATLGPLVAIRRDEIIRVEREGAAV